MADKIKLGETNAALKTVFFALYTSDGLLASGGPDANYEGALADATGATLEVENNLLGWSTKTGTFGHHGNGEFYYTFADAEVATTQIAGTIAFRFQKTGFRNQVARVPLVVGDVSAVLTELTAIGGLLHRNALADTFTYDPGSGDMLTCRVRVFTNATALAAATIGAADNADGEVARFTLTGTIASNKPASFKARQVLP